MSWMRFLAAGQSFIGMKRKQSPFRETGQSWLRSVGAMCRPETAGSGVNPDARGARSLAGSAEGASLLPAASVQRPTRQQGSELFGIAELSADPAGSLKTGEVVSTRRTRSDRSRITGSLFKSRRPLVQGELSLDTVKVMRNDLHDSDLELIPMEPVAPAVAKGARAARGLFSRGATPVPNLVQAQP